MGSTLNIILTPKQTEEVLQLAHDLRIPLLTALSLGLSPKRIKKVVNPGNANHKVAKLDEKEHILMPKPKRIGESNEHKELKVIGLKFLRELGCRQITEEYHARRDSMHIDVFGSLDGKKIALECGGSSPKKLIKLYGWADRIYILPYGETRPFLWQPNIKICRTCGHEVNGVKGL